MTGRLKLFTGATVLAFGAACTGAKTDQPVVTKTDAGSAISPAGTDAAKAGKSMVRLVNAVPSKVDVELTGDGRTLFTGVKYEAVTDYAEVSDNLIALGLRRVGLDSTLADNHEMMRDGVRYTVVALPGDKGTLQLRVITDDVAPVAGKARLRVINASPSVKDLDVAIQGQREPIFKAIDFADNAGYKDIPPTTATIEIRRDTKGVKPVLLKDLHLAAGRSYTIVITGGHAGTVEAFTFSDTELK